MKTLLKVFFLAIIGSETSGLAQGTAFSYQGRLNQNGNPATGVYDLRFTAYNSLTAPTPAGGPISINSVPVSNGLFTVMLDFGTGLFTGPQRWLEIGMRTNGAASFTILEPRQMVTAVPYAMHAGTASNVAGSVVKTLNGLRDDVSLAAGANVTISPAGNTLTITAAGAGGSGIWSVDNNNAYYTAGNVSVGTGIATHRLTVAAPDQETMRLLNSTTGFGQGARLNFGDGDYVFIEEDLDDRLQIQANRIAVMGGNVGIGTATPNHRLSISGGPIWTANGWGGALELDNASAIGWRANASGNRFGIGQSGGGLYFFASASDPGNSANPANYVMVLNDDANVGIGTTTPQARLDVAGGIHASGRVEIETQDALKIQGYQPFITMADRNAFGLIHPPRRYIQAVEDDLHILYQLPCNAFPCSTATEAHMTIKGNGNVGIGTTTPQAKLDVAGSLRTTVLTITGGADIAEPFQMSSSEIPKGSVVVIDEQNPGHLKLSTQAYDTRVAGVVSGANGIKPGISLHQEGAIDGGENVALSGRVYVRVDAAFGAIKPGDLLTTCDTAGHAMIVTDHARAQGAILGKAMSALDEGKGMVLVLVTLQ